LSLPPPGTPLCRLDELADPGARGFNYRIGDEVFRGFVVRRGGAVHGWLDRCPHLGLPLTLGDDRYLTREGDLILCCSHGALFSPDTGACISGPCAGQALKTWPVMIRNDLVVTA
jgi:nitrite reductase/ring-hydroxylating ferredoxin subunit